MCEIADRRVRLQRVDCCAVGDGPSPAAAATAGVPTPEPGTPVPLPERAKLDWVVGGSSFGGESDGFRPLSWVSVGPARPLG